MEFLTALQESPIGNWVKLSLYAHPMLLVLHALGMAAVVGTVLAFDVRVLGFAKGIPVMAYEKMLPLAWGGFAVNATSGILIFCANSVHLMEDWSFRIKMLLIIAGGMSLWLLWRRIRAKAERAPGGDFEVDPGDKIVAVLSIVFWLGAIVAGRLIAYTIAEF